MKEITQYLKDVATLECQVYTQEKLISKLQQNASRLGRKKNIKEPILKTTYASPDYGMYLFISIGIAVFGIVAQTLFLSKIFPKKFLVEHNDFFLIWLPIIIFVSTFVLLIFHYQQKEKRENKRNYEWELKNYNNYIREDNLRVKQELPVKHELETQINRIMRTKQATETALASLYSVGVIHPKYRNLVAIATFYDYFDTGRCNKLTGPGGAYDTYAYECHFQYIETKLDVIISKLDQIIENQHLIASLMQESNSMLHRIERQNDRMMKSMDRIQENTELTEYNTRCAAQSAAIMEHIAIYHALKYE